MTCPRPFANKTVVLLQGNLNPRRRDMILAAYEQLDRDGSGVVTLSDIKQAYSVKDHPEVKAGKKSEEEALREFMDQWETDSKDGTITREEFLDYYKDVSASVDDDDYFELMIRNAWHISGGEGWSENTANRRVLVKHSDGTEEVVEIKNDLGVKADDVQEMIKRLELQGVRDIKGISLAD